MAGIRSRDTQPEVSLRKALWSLGVRGYRKHPNLPGRPDLLFPRLKVVVFVDGCFWHGCPEHHTMPRSNTDYWIGKLDLNRRRDSAVNDRIEGMGYCVLRIWEHEVNSGTDAAARRVQRTLAARESRLPGAG